MNQELETYINDLDNSINDLKNLANYHYKGMQIKDILNDVVFRCKKMLENIDSIRLLNR